MKSSPNNRLQELLEDHENLARFFSDLEKYENYSNATKKCMIIEQTIQFVSQHHIREEKTMLYFKYPKLEEHIKYHEAVRNEIMILTCDLIKSASTEQFLTIVEMYKAQFQNHLQQIDQEFFDWLKENNLA